MYENIWCMCVRMCVYYIWRLQMGSSLPPPSLSQRNGRKINTRVNMNRMAGQKMLRTDTYIHICICICIFIYSDTLTEWNQHKIDAIVTILFLAKRRLFVYLLRPVTTNTLAIVKYNFNELSKVNQQLTSTHKT